MVVATIQPLSIVDSPSVRDFFDCVGVDLYHRTNYRFHQTAYNTDTIAGNWRKPVELLSLLMAGLLVQFIVLLISQLISSMNHLIFNKPL